MTTNDKILDLFEQKEYDKCLTAIVSYMEEHKTYNDKYHKYHIKLVHISDKKPLLLETNIWIIRGANAGISTLQEVRGHMYYSGNGVRQSYNMSLTQFRKSAIQGNICGQYYVGYMYYFGRGVTKDLKKAIQMFKLSAE